MAKISTLHKKLCRKTDINHLNKNLKPKQSTTDFLLNYSKSLEAKNGLLISLN